MSGARKLEAVNFKFCGEEDVYTILRTLNEYPGVRSTTKTHVPFVVPAPDQSSFCVRPIRHCQLKTIAYFDQPTLVDQKFLDDLAARCGDVNVDFSPTVCRNIYVKRKLFVYDVSYKCSSPVHAERREKLIALFKRTKKREWTIDAERRAKLEALCKPKEVQN